MGGNYGYGHSKQALFGVLLKKYYPASERFDYCMNHLDEVENALEIGAEKVKKVALQERL